MDPTLRKFVNVLIVIKNKQEKCNSESHETKAQWKLITCNNSIKTSFQEQSLYVDEDMYVNQMSEGIVLLETTVCEVCDTIFLPKVV